ncbi:MAG: alpha/beta fold hydrolase [Planctomycetota bacterium]
MTEQGFSAASEQQYELKYLLYLPSGYGDAAPRDAVDQQDPGDQRDKIDPEDAGERYPLVLFLHGSGERGDDLSKVKLWGVPKRLATGKGRWADFPAIVVSPQCPAENERWDTDELLALIDSIEARYRVDPDRVYVTGLSMGGYATWALAERAPERFAAIVPICGGYPYAPIAAPRRLRRLPAWAFHGDADQIVPVTETLDVVVPLKRAGGDVRWTVFEGVGHVSWPMAYEMDELWEWLFRQRRSAREAPDGS